MKIRKLLKSKAAKVAIIATMLTGMLGTMVFGDTYVIENTYSLGQTRKNESKANLSYDSNLCSYLEYRSVPFPTLNISHKATDSNATTITKTAGISYSKLASGADYTSGGQGIIYLVTTYDKYCQYASFSATFYWTPNMSKN